MAVSLLKEKFTQTNPEEEENEKFENALVNVIQSQIQQNEQRMQHVIDGLAQVTSNRCSS